MAKKKKDQAFISLRQKLKLFFDLPFLILKNTDYIKKAHPKMGFFYSFL